MSVATAILVAPIGVEQSELTSPWEALTAPTGLRT